MANNEVLRMGKTYLEKQDYRIENEIMVTVTIEEYRRLVSFHAKYEASLRDAERKVYDMKNELNEFKQGYDRLRAKCDKYERLLDGIRERKESDDPYDLGDDD